MKRVIALALVMAIGMPQSAHADVDVNPSKVRPRLFIEVERSDEYRAHWTKRHHGQAQPVVRRYMDCRTDAEVLKYGCRTYLPADPDDPELTEGEILRAVREIGLPSLEVQIQPGTSTLVNVPTIFFAEPQMFNRSVTLLGFDIDVVATPVSYRWLHGDGTASVTTKPGKPYPSTDVTYRYPQPAEAVNPRVDVTYQVRYRVDGGGWNTIDQTLMASGPTAALEVKEAAPVLTHP